MKASITSRTLKKPFHWHLTLWVFEKFAENDRTFFNAVSVETAGTNVWKLRDRAVSDFGDGVRALTHVAVAKTCSDATHLFED